MKKMFSSPFHLVELSPWPILISMGVLLLVGGLLNLFYNTDLILLFIGLITVSLIMIQWWRDVDREASMEGLHTKKVLWGLKFSMILFIISEIMFFLSFFWALFHSSLSPCNEIGEAWPPLGIETLDFMAVPLLNTCILLSSGVTVTWSHHDMMENNWNSCQSLLMTVILGFYFMNIQMLEYFNTSFTMMDSIYGSVFFVATGFHGFHVFVGSIFLAVCLFRMMKGKFSSEHFFGFEAASWYWHFVDVVWLFLFIFFYWWSS